MKYVRSTLVKVFDNNGLLLGMKKRGLGVGKWNGFGGKLSPNETVEQCAIRELHEESGLKVEEKDLHQIGILMFEFLGEDFFMEVNVFRTSVFKGMLLESEEMKPKWFAIENVPFDKMWADDILWYPLMLQQKLFFGFFKFQGHDNMVFNNLVVVKNLEDMKACRDQTRKDYSFRVD